METTSKNNITAEELMLKNLDKKEHNFGMFTKAGGNRIRTLCKKATRKAFGKKRVTETEMENYLIKELDKLDSKYPECWDTEPRNIVESYTNSALKVVGYSFKIMI